LRSGPCCLESLHRLVDHTQDIGRADAQPLLKLPKRIASDPVHRFGTTEAQSEVIRFVRARPYFVAAGDESKRRPFR
jgi:hypothetical protein